MRHPERLFGSLRALTLTCACAWAALATATPSAGQRRAPGLRPGSFPARTFAVQRAPGVTARQAQGLPLSFGVAVDPQGTGRHWRLFAADEEVEGSFTVLGWHADGRTGTLLVECADPGTGELRLVEGPPGGPGRRARPALAVEGGVPAQALRIAEQGAKSLPGLELVLTGLDGSQVVTPLELAETHLRGHLARVDRLVGLIEEESGKPLLWAEAYVTRWSFVQELAQVELVLRNDFVVNAHGPVGFRQAELRLLEDGPWTRLAPAWARSNGVEADGSAATLFPKRAGAAKELWLGDRQGKAWRFALATSAIDSARWAAARLWLEKPSLLLPDPAEAAATGWYGPIDSEVAVPRARWREAVEREADRMRWGWENGWAGSRGDEKFSNSTGSARCGPIHEATLLFLQTGDRRFFDSAFESAYAQALRPIFREFDASKHPKAWLWDGKPRQRSGADLLGRDRPRRLPAAWRVEREFEWLDEWHGWNGFDFEHLTIDLVRDGYLATGSLWMKREALAIGESLLTYDQVRQARAVANPRSFGWMLHVLCQLDAIDDDRRWMQAGATLVRGAAANRVVRSEHTWLKVFAPDSRGLGESAFSYPWQIAVAMMGLDDYLAREPGIAKSEAEELLGELARTLTGPALDAKTGLFKAAVNPMNPSRFRPGERGTEEWIPSSLIRAWARLPEDPARGEWLEAAQRYARAQRPTLDMDATRGSWKWWQAFAAAQRAGFGSDSAGDGRPRGD